MLKNIYEDDVENESKGYNESLDPLTEKDGAESVPEEAESIIKNTINPPAPISGKPIEPDEPFDESKYEPVLGNALKIRYRIFNDTTIRSTVDDNKNAWFVADDVCKVLGYKNTFKAIADHCGKVIDSKDIDHDHCLARKITVKTNGGNQAMVAISEGDLYRLIMRSRMPEAKRFEMWVCDDLLPSLRKNNGRYVIKKKIDCKPQNGELKPATSDSEPELCELFPRMVPSVSLPVDITDRLNSVKRRLYSEGHTFPNNKEFVKFLVNRALEDLEA